MLRLLRFPGPQTGDLSLDPAAEIPAPAKTSGHSLPPTLTTRATTAPQQFS